jgi:hypothetical protein
MPAHVFLKPGDRTYPVKTKRGGAWVYSRALLLAAARRARMNGEPGIAARADRIRAREFGSKASKEIVTTDALSQAGKKNPALQYADLLSADEVAFGILDVEEPEKLIEGLVDRRDSLFPELIVPILDPIFSNDFSAYGVKYAVVDDPDDPEVLYGIVSVRGYPSTYGSVDDLLEALPEDQLFMPEVDRVGEGEVRVVAVGLETAFDPPQRISTVYGPAEEADEAMIQMENERESSKARLVTLVKEKGGPHAVEGDRVKKKLTLLMLEPDYIDAHDDVIREELIEESAHDWLDRATRGGKKINYRHGPDVTDEVKVCESYCTKSDQTFVDPVYGEQLIKKGAWLVTLGLSDRLWEKVEQGKIDGGSFDGTAVARILDPDFLIPEQKHL